MTRTLHNARWLVLCAATALGFGLNLPHAQAASLSASGWWWRAQSGVVPLPPPAGTPEGGLVIGNAPDGPTAVAAVRYLLASSEENPVLTLEVAGEINGAQASLVACRASSPWSAANAGEWSSRPQAACELGAANGAAAADGESWTFDLSSLANGDVVDVVILPATTAGTGLAFQVAFAPPGPNAFRTTTRSVARPDSSPSIAPVAPAPSAVSPPVASADPSPAPAPAPSPAESPVATKDEPAPTVFAQPARGGAAVPGDTPQTRLRLLAALYAATVLASWWVLRRQPIVAGEGGVLTAAIGGVGRFRHPREGEAPEL